MGWRLKKTKSAKGWYLLKITDHGRYTDKNGKIKSKRKSESVSDDVDLLKLKFNPKWNYPEAKEYYDKIFKVAEAKERRQTRIKAALDKIKDKEIEESKFLPRYLVDKFYSEFLIGRFCIDSKTKKLPNGYTGYWNSAMTLIKEVKIEPHEYYIKPNAFYRYAIEKGLSPSWYKKIIRFVNLWGYFYCYETKQAYLPIPPPPRIQYEKMYDAFYDKRGGNLESDPITFEILDNLKISDEHNDFDYKDAIESKHFKFLYICTAFGLRPSECERILDDKVNAYYRIAKDDLGTTCLHIYQPKLISLPRAKRWKIIPVLFSEQEAALAYIKEKKFKKPLTKTLHRLISPKHNNYGCRKSFLDTMISRGQKIENVSLWLGHVSIDRSLKNYRQRNIVHYDFPDKTKKVKSAV